MKNLVLIAFTSLVCLPTCVLAETIKTTGIDKSLDADFQYKIPCTNPVTGVAGVSSYYIAVRYFEIPESLNSTVLKPLASLSVDLQSSCSYYALPFTLRGDTSDSVYPGQVTAFINPNMKNGNLYVNVPLYDITSECLYQGTLSLNFEAISNPNNLGVTDKTYITDRDKIIFHGVLRETQAKATGQFTIKKLYCYPEFADIPSPPNNFTAFPSTDARIRNLYYSEITITKK